MGRILLLMLATLGLLVPGLHAAPGADEVLPDDYIVGFLGGVPGDVRPGAEFHGGIVERVDEALRFAVVETRTPVVFEVRAQSDPRVRYVEWDNPEYAITQLVPNDARYGDSGHYGSKIIGAEAAWDRTLGSTAVKVAVIDSGLRKTHEEFAGSGRVLQGWDFVQNDNDPNDNCGHGTHVAGTIGATINNGLGIAGLAQATILPIRGLSATLILCTGSTSDLASALRFAADEGAHLSSNSWGGGSSTSITNAINYAHGKGVTHVAAAGNDGQCSDCVSEPWAGNEGKVIIVASTTSGDGQSSFSSEGPEVDVAAPGSSILSTYNSNDASYNTLSGTSMATPHVAGTLALVKTLNPGFGYAELDQRIKDTAVDLGAAGKDDAFGFGRIDADAATAGSGGGGGGGNQAPTASFTFSCTDLACDFDGSGSSDPDGSITAYDWDFGDGNTASGAVVSHTYGAAGTYSVSLTVTDNGSATDAETQSVEVTDGSGGGGDPDPSVPNLENGVAKSDSLSGSGAEKFYKIQVPSGQSQLQVVLDGPNCSGLLTIIMGCNPDLDLYVRQGAKPTDSDWDCRPFANGSDETCTLSSPAGDWWYIRVDLFSGSSASYTIKATYS